MLEENETKHEIQFSLPEPGDKVVISGISGRFPESDNILHLQENLFNKADLLTDDDRRWTRDRSLISQRSGKINNLEKFDAQFFGVHFREAHTMDPMGRMLLEHTFEAIVDAGVNPRQLRGTNTGVFIGMSSSESRHHMLYATQQTYGLGLIGCSHSMMANRISRWFGCKGPSYTVDSACSSSMYAVDQAYRAIISGQCEAAIVGGCNLCLHPGLTQQFELLGILSPDGKCKSFDADANGYCRSEAVSVIYLQKSKDARRLYAQIVHTKTNCDGFKEEGITYPSATMQRVLLEELYEECKILPYTLSYFETHGTGTRIGDTVELNAIEKVFCPGRTTPLLIGTVKTNLGHTEPASGLCSVAKVVIAMESGYIPPNLHFNRPREGIPVLQDGRLQVVTEKMPWKCGYVGINSFGFGGTNAHVLLKSNPKEKINDGLLNDDMPRLVVVSGRTEEAVATLLDNLESRPVDVEYVGLFHNIYAEDIPGHLYRGFTILPPTTLPKNCIRDVQKVTETKRSLLFIFSGLEFRSAELGEALLKIPAFARAIKKCADVLKPHGVDLIGILTTRSQKKFDDILHSLIVTIAIQIGLVDILSSIGIVPEMIMGYSTGELCCAYADGCLTAEQTVLAAYFIGVASMETVSDPESMASIGLGNKKLVSLCPPDINIIWQDTENSIISGQKKFIEVFVGELQAAGITTDKFFDNDVGFQTRDFSTASSKLLAYLRHIIPNPRARSQRWLSTSMPPDDWDSKLARFCSPEYLVKNLLNPVSLEETSLLIRNDATIIELAPHSVMQSALHSSLSKRVTNIALTSSDNLDHVTVLLKAIGRMYETGLKPQLADLYPAVQYPVSRGTPMISPLIRWDHSDDWYVVSFKDKNKIDTAQRIIRISLAEEDYGWMSGHVIDGRNLVPPTGYLHLVWTTIALMQGELSSEVPVVFEDVRFHRATTIPAEGKVELTCMIQIGSGRFEIDEDATTVVSGYIHTLSKLSQQRFRKVMSVEDKVKLELMSRDIYKELRLRGYQYTGLFRGLRSASLNGREGRIKWENNWSAFMDNMLQMEMLSIDSRGLFVPTSIRKLVIDTKKHLSQLNAMPNNLKEFTVRVDKQLDSIISGGIEICGLRTTPIPRRKPADDPVLERYTFVAHRDRFEITLAGVTSIALHIALENHSSVKIKTIEFIGEQDDISPENLTSLLILEILANVPLLLPELIVAAPVNKFVTDTIPNKIKFSEPNEINALSGALFAVGHGLLANDNKETFVLIDKALENGGFLLLREPLNATVDIPSATNNENFNIILEKRTAQELILLLRKKVVLPDVSEVIKFDNHDFAWIPALKSTLNTKMKQEVRSTRRILLLGEGSESGLLGFVNCLRREISGIFIQGLLIQDPQAPKFSLKDSFYSEQLELGLALNVLRAQNSWGSYRFLAIDPPAKKPVYHVQMVQETPGDLSTMKWVEGPLQPTIKRENIVEIHYSSINFRDVMRTTGKLATEVAAKTRLSQDNVLGFEYSGRDANGRAVMGMTATGGLSNLHVCEKDLLWLVPESWTLEDAATVPVVYGTAYYALFLIGDMNKGDKVLIHAGSGGVGQAAITLALHEECEVFTTVGTPQKREFIRKQFPQIDDDHIGNSRDTSFEQLVLQKTRGRGVDIVLNSLAEEKLQASVRCLAIGGRFLEIGKFDLAANNPLGMEAFLKGISFHGIFLDNLFTTPSERRSQLTRILDEGLKNDVIKPLVKTVFPMDQVEAAFRYMAAGKHVGKVLIKIRKEDGLSPSAPLLAYPRYNCSEYCSYLLLGGLGGFGLELADWLVLRGAKKLVMTSRKGISTGYQRMRVEIWRSYGVEVVIIVGKDASTHEGCEAILKEAVVLGPLDAIFNLAIVLKDGLFENQTAESFEESLRVKAWATEQLDKLSRTWCPQLRHFVVFSSVSCGRGNAGQTNYGMANSIMERICETRAAANLPGLAVQWGTIGDVGLVAEMQEDHEEIVIGGTLQQKIHSCLQELDGFLQQDAPVVSSMVVAEKSAGGAGAANVADAVVQIMGLKTLKTISLHTPLAELGMDSMMAIEIKQTLERDFEVFLSASDIRNLNFLKLQELSLKQATNDEDLEHTAENEFNDLDGLNLLLRTLGKDHTNKDVCVPLRPSKAEDEGREVFLIPGIEGNSAVFQCLTDKLKTPTTCLQLPTISKSTSVEDLVDYLIPYIKARVMNPKNFAVAGYSFGSLVAIELVRRLESEGFFGRLVLIDGAPDDLKAIVNQHSMPVTDDYLQLIILQRIMDILMPSRKPNFIEDIKNCSTWEERLVVFTKNIPEDNTLNFEVEEQKAICTSIFHRIKAVLNYDASTLAPLKTPVTLIKPRIRNVRCISEDYGLRSITEAKVEVYHAEGNHLTMLDDDICAAAINGELFKEIL